MFDPYRAIFEKRGQMYNAASRLVPGARETERQLAIRRLALEPGQRVLDVPAGGGYMADGILALHGERVEIVCVEPSAVFAADLDARYTRLVSGMEVLPLRDASVDAVGSLAGLHHLDHDRKRGVFAEMLRVLVPGGRVVVADVQEATAAGAFLNGPVNRYCETGHDGMFLPAGWTSNALSEVGFVDTEEALERFTWDFPDRDTMHRYCWNLFGLTLATLDQVALAIDEGLPVTEDDGGVRFGWSLVYAVGRRPDG